MKKVKGTLSITETIEKLNNKFNGVNILDEKKKGGKLWWMSRLGYSNMFTDPDEPKEWLDWMLTGIDEDQKFNKDDYVPDDQRAHVLTMVFAYANYLVRTVADILAEKDLEIMIRNDFIQEHCDFNDFMEFRNSSLKE